MSLIAISIILLILVFLLLMPLGIGVKYENGAFLIVKVSFLSFNISFEGIIDKLGKKKKKQKPAEDAKVDLEKEIDKSITDIDFIITLFGDFRRKVRSGFTLKNFDLIITMGTAEAASTAVLTGMLYGFAYNLLALADKIVYVDNPKVNIKPQFNDATFKLTLNGIITTRLVHIIATAFVFAYKFFKYKHTNKEEN